MRIDDINAMADADIRENEQLKKLSEEVYGKGVLPDYEEGFVDGYNKAKENYEVTTSVRELHQYKLGLEDGYNKAKETLYTKQDLIDLVQSLKDYTHQSHTILGHDEREASEFVEIYLDPFKEDKTAWGQGMASDEISYEI
jgi:hypothetical protein